MSNGFGQSPKKQTVYSGPAPNLGQGTVYGGPTIKTSEGTVYNGPVGGTMHQGPAVTGSYNHSRQSARMATTAGNAGAAKGARVFYVIAAFTAIRTLLLFFGVQQLTLGANRMLAGDAQAVMTVNWVIVGILLLLGFLTQRGSKLALLIGMLLYAADMVLLVVNDASANIVYIVVHGLFLYYLFSAYRQFAD